MAPYECFDVGKSKKNVYAVCNTRTRYKIPTQYFVFGSPVVLRNFVQCLTTTRFLVSLLLLLRYKRSTRGSGARAIVFFFSLIPLLISSKILTLSFRTFERPKCENVYFPIGFGRRRQVFPTEICLTFAYIKNRS